MFRFIVNHTKRDMVNDLIHISNIICLLVVSRLINEDSILEDMLLIRQLLGAGHLAVLGPAPRTRLPRIVDARELYTNHLANHPHVQYLLLDRTRHFGQEAMECMLLDPDLLLES